MPPVPSAAAPRNPDAAFKPLRRVCRVVCTFFYIPVLLLNSSIASANTRSSVQQL